MFSKPISFAFLTLGLLAAVSTTSAHEDIIHPLDVSRRQLEANRRHVQARNCAPQIAAYNQKRKLKRSLARRAIKARVPQGHGSGAGGHGPGGFGVKGHGGNKSRLPPPPSGSFSHTVEDATSTAEETASAVASSTTSAEQPSYSTIQNSTCITVPEVTEGPYFIRNELLRSDIREDQDGVLLLLDIGVMDTSTCTPLEAALVEIWHCNATGQYSGFTAANSGGGGGEAPSGDPSGSGSGAPPTGAPPTDSLSSGAAVPTGGPPNGGGGGASTPMTDDLSFLRGGFATNAEGMVEFKTIYPGFYTGRTVHIHTMVQTQYTVLENGTIASGAGDHHHIGQIFFDEELNDQVLAQAAYTDTTQTRTFNADDGIMLQESANGYNAIADAEFLGADVSEGILAYITIGVDTTLHVNVTTTNYATTFLFDGAAAESTST